MSTVTRPKYWNGLEATGYPFEMKVAEELEKAKWHFIPDYPVSVSPDAANLPGEETSIDFKSWQNSLFALIEARRAAYCEWILFRKIDTRGFFVLSHGLSTQQWPGFQFNLRESTPRDMRSWIHCQSLDRFQTDRGIYSDVVSVNGKGECKDSGEDQQESKGEIRKGAKQASTAAIGVMNDDFAFLERAPAGVTPPDTGRLYFPVITTAAKVSVLDISADQINEHGILPNVDKIDPREVPWAVYRWSLPRSLWLPVSLPQNAINDHTLLEKHRKLDIFVVNIKHLGEFLEEIKDIVE